MQQEKQEIDTRYNAQRRRDHGRHLYKDRKWPIDGVSAALHEDSAAGVRRICSGVAMRGCHVERAMCCERFVPARAI